MSSTVATTPPARRRTPPFWAQVLLGLAIDPILDMMRTATNVAGQALIPTIVAKRNGLLDPDVYNAADIDSIDRVGDDEPARGAQDQVLATTC